MNYFHQIVLKPP